MIIRVALLCLVCVLVSACGGGGGGGQTSAPPAPAPPAFALTEANAVQAAAYALAPLEQLLPAESLVMNAAAFMRAYGVPQWTISCSATPPVSLTITYNDRDASGDVSVGDVIDVPGADCAGLRRKLTFTLTQLTTALDQVAGRLEAEIEVDGMKIVGGFDASLSFVPATSTVTWRMADAMVTLTKASTTQTVRLTSGQFAFTPTNYSFTLTGGSVESEHLGGTYAFATATPLSGALRRLPTSGELLLSTAGGSRARITPPATQGTVEETVEYAVAATSSGSFGPTQSTLWTAIIRGLLFGWRPNEAPTLTNLQIQPANPAPGASLWVSYTAQDINGDQLQTTFEWRHNGTVVGTNQSLNIATVRHDQISVTVTVSDGRLSATASTNIVIGNPPPVMTSLTITPAQPNSADDLVAVPNVFEPDGDPVTLTYEWKRNGTVIANRTAATLPASETTRNDVISVRVQASDGNSTVEATASTTILDSPPRVSVVSPPTTVAYGAPVTFTATLDDPDGDPLGPLDFALAYGPAGMTVDPDTGIVTWTASGPMFDRTTTFRWGITVDDPSALLATGTIDVTDATADYPLLRFGTEVPTWPAGLSVADFDADGDTEMLIMSRRWLFELESDGAGGYRQSWAYPYALNVDTQYSITSLRNSMVTGDVDGDGKHEVFASVGPTLTKLDGVERRVVAQREIDPYEVCADLQYADLENDGAPDLVCLSTSDYWTDTARIIVLRPSDLSTRYEFPRANYGRSFALGNVDTDPALEIVTASGYVFDGATFANQWLYSPGFGMDVDTGDLDGDGVEEIVAAQDWYIVTGFSATLKTPLWEIQGSDLDSLLVADVAGDARPEIVVGDGQAAHLTIYRYNTATNGVDVVDEVNWQSSGVTSIGVGDVDADGQRELIFGSGVSTSGPDVLLVAGLNPALEIEWENADPIQLDGPFKGGELAGSPLASPAPLFVSLRTNSGYDGARLVRMPADGGALEISAMVDTNWAASGGIDVVDYDNDLTDEAFLAVNSYYNGLFRAYDFFSNTSEWASPTVPNQASAVDVTHADLTGDGRDDLIGITSAGVVYAHDVYQQTLIWQSTTLNGGQRVFAANLDGDANDEPEIVVLGYRFVYVYRRNPLPGTAYLQIANYQATRDIVDIDVGDTDGDGDLEVVLLVGDSYSSGSSEVIRLDENLQSVGSFALPWSAQTLTIETSPTPRKNLIVSRIVDQYSYAGTILIVGARSGGVVFESPPLMGVVQPNSVHYVTLPGETRPTVSIGTTAGMYLTR